MDIVNAGNQKERIPEVGDIFTPIGSSFENGDVDVYMRIDGPDLLSSDNAFLAVILSEELPGRVIWLRREKEYIILKQKNSLEVIKE